MSFKVSINKVSKSISVQEASVSQEVFSQTFCPCRNFTISR